MKLEVGMFVRTKYGIKKIETYNYHEKMAQDLYEYNDQHIYKQDVLKSSHNIIDLIEVGDFVNGKKVSSTTTTTIFTEDEQFPWFDNCELEEVLTHEQYESMVYKIER